MRKEEIMKGTRRTVLRKKSGRNAAENSAPHPMSQDASPEVKALGIQRHCFIAGFHDGLAGIRKSEIPDYVSGLFARAKFFGDECLRKAEALYRSGLAEGYEKFRAAHK
jgi:hypothetical protein